MGKGRAFEAESAVRFIGICCGKDNVGKKIGEKSSADCNGNISIEVYGYCCKNIEGIRFGDFEVGGYLIGIGRRVDYHAAGMQYQRIHIPVNTGVGRGVLGVCA